MHGGINSSHVSHLSLQPRPQLLAQRAVLCLFSRRPQPRPRHQILFPPCLVSREAAHLIPERLTSPPNPSPSGVVPAHNCVSAPIDAGWSSGACIIARVGQPPRTPRTIHPDTHREHLLDRRDVPLEICLQVPRVQRDRNDALVAVALRDALEHDRAASAVVPARGALDRGFGCRRHTDSASRAAVTREAHSRLRSRSRAILRGRTEMWSHLRESNP